MRLLLALCLFISLKQVGLAQEVMRPALPLAPDMRALYEKGARVAVRDAIRRKQPLPDRKGEVVPTQDVAIEIHITVASAVFGKDYLAKQFPYFAIRSGGFWVVYGSLPLSSLGGTAETVIRASNGEVIRVSHSQ